MQYIISFLIGYFLGCLNLAYTLSKIYKKDLQNSGSGNLGASNAVINLGKRAGLAVMMHDIFKTIIATLIIKQLYGVENLELVYIAGVASVLGHIFPFWLKFKAGKGFAPYIGLIASTMNIKHALILLAFCITMIIITDYIVSATFSSIIALPIYTYLVYENIILVGIILVASLVIFIKHIENIQRIIKKEEWHVRSTLTKKRNNN